MPVITPEMLTLIDRGHEGTYFDSDRQPHVPRQMDRYAIECQIEGTKLYRLLPNQSRHLWLMEDVNFIAQLKALFISQYIAGEWVVVE